VAREFSIIPSVVALVAALIGCGPAIPDYQLAQLPSGRVLRVLNIEDIPLEGDDAGLRLDYETDLALDDRIALYREVEAIWDEFRVTQKAAGKSLIVIKATTQEAPGWSRERTGVEYAIRLEPDGHWKFANSGQQRGSLVSARREQ
jgi:hypothetical protein